jgi:hypothetical protein
MSKGGGHRQRKLETLFRSLGPALPEATLVSFQDLGALTVWVMRDYDSVEPIILSVPEKDEVTTTNNNNNNPQALVLPARL